MGSRENRRKKSKIAEENVRGAEKKKSSNRLMWFGSLVLLILIVVTFVGAPVITQLGKSERIIFGTYNGKPIEFKTGNYFSRQRDYIADQVQRSEQSDNLEWQIYQVWKEAYDRTVVHTALLDMADSGGMVVTEDRLDRLIVEEGPYTVNGEFSERLYNSTSNIEKQANRTFMLESILSSQVRQHLLTPAVSKKEVDFFKSMAAVERKFRFVSFSFNDFPSRLVTEYGQKNRDVFRKISLSRITIKSGEKEAETLYQQIQGDPALFGDLARSHSTDAFSEKGGEMGILRFYSAESMFAEPSDAEYIFSLKEGEISRIIEGPSGFMIYRCDAEAVYPDFSSEEEIIEVRNYMNRFERGQIEDYFILQAEELIAEAEQKGFESTVLGRGKLYKETDYFPVNYGNLAFQFYGTPYPVFQEITVNGSPDQVLQPGSQDVFFLSRIHSLAEKELSPPLILNDAVLVMQCTGIRTVGDEDLEILSMVYPAAVQDWYEQDLKRLVFTSNAFQDNFMSEFTRLFLNQEQ